jgi:hypothetical protein
VSKFNDFFWGKNLLNDEKTPSVKVLHREPTSDELVLGWAVNTDELTLETVELTKGISQSAREAHFYVVGATRTGKTKFLESLIEQDIKNGEGFCVIDPHGDLTEDVKGYLYLMKGEEFLQENVVVIDPTDEQNIVAFNPLERTRGEKSAAVASELTEAFKKIWADAWGQRMEDLLKNTLVALIENDLTLAELPTFLTNRDIRLKILENVKHEGCRQYFYERFNAQRPQTQNEWMESTLNKVNGFLFDDRVKQMFLSRKSSFDLRDIMDNHKILLVKLDSGRLKGTADLLGSLLLAKIQAAAFTRTDTPESKRQPFYLYIDEFQNFATDSFIKMLSESAKYKLSVILAHQNLAQLPSALRASILSNCGIQAYFRISRDDSNILAKESLAPIYNNPPGWEGYIQILQELLPRQCYIKNKTLGGVVEIRQTLDHPKPYEKAGAEDEDEFIKEVAACEIGKNYLRDRAELEAEYRARKNALTMNDAAEAYKEKRI